jgi:soluble lytic murein transglycosylase-like protein
MQLMDATAEDLGVTDSLDPEQNIMGGSRFLKKLIDRYQDVELALAAYNAGPGNVDKYGGLPPFAETQNYVTKVMALFEEATKSPKVP